MAGVDGVGPRWVVATVRSPSQVEWEVCADPAAVLARTGNCAAVGVDIPLGLADDRYRACDLDAKKRLAGAASSVFHAPPRATLEAVDHREANAIARRIRGTGMSIQTWGLVRKIVDWDEQELPATVVEVHPEVSFRTMPGEVSAGKKTARGVGQRLRVLAHWLDLPAMLDDLPDRVPMDDALDALACAWTAARWARGAAEVLGGGTDGHDKPMRIVV